MSDTQQKPTTEELSGMELSRTLQNGQNEEAKSQSSKMIEREKVEGTMFDVITMEEGSFVALGENRVTDYQEKEKCIEMVKDKDWQLIEQMCILICNFKLKEQTKNQK